MVYYAAETRRAGIWFLAKFAKVNLAAPVKQVAIRQAWRSPDLTSAVRPPDIDPLLQRSRGRTHACRKRPASGQGFSRGDQDGFDPHGTVIGKHQGGPVAEALHFFKCTGRLQGSADQYR